MLEISKLSMFCSVNQKGHTQRRDWDGPIVDRVGKSDYPKYESVGRAVLIRKKMRLMMGEAARTRQPVSTIQLFSSSLAAKLIVGLFYTVANNALERNLCQCHTLKLCCLRPTSSPVVSQDLMLSVIFLHSNMAHISLELRNDASCCRPDNVLPHLNHLYDENESCSEVLLFSHARC